ncbi:hypothetical protein LTR84_000795 [Exophiala bonariae]|uniref:SNF2 N-terminal domain-containing protein n=1 Tax=Exophiala bonariae TaxID=1690606 RepID=A0AAV9NS57_9EURO|nr:hypothetical protein LTR84_000795 [Exophiala bonariae]
MGLAKTVTMIAHMHERIRRIELMKDAGEHITDKNKPILFIVPPSLTRQATRAIKVFSLDLEPFAYYGDGRIRSDIHGKQIKTLLKADHPFFDGGIYRKVIVSPHPTWQSRDGPAKLTKWRMENG